MSTTRPRRAKTLRTQKPFVPTDAPWPVPWFITTRSGQVRRFFVPPDISGAIEQGRGKAGAR